MNTPVDTLLKTSTPTSTSGPRVPVRRATRHVSLRQPRVPRWWRDAFGVFVWSSMLVVVALWVSGGGIQALLGVGTGLTSLGRLTGLVASDLLLLQVLMLARGTLVE